MIELMVAIAIAALLLLLGVPTFTTFLRNSEIRSTSESLINGLRAATAEAARRNRPVTFELASATSAGWRFYVLDDLGVQQELQTYNKNEAGSNSKIMVTPAGQLTVTFDGLGRVVSPGADDHIQFICVYIATAANCGLPVADFRPLQLIVDDMKNPPVANKPRGLRLCDPDPALAALVPPDPRAC
jgi:type IV fimbrial biogenesis protein FimT